MPSNLLRNLPSVHELLESPALRNLKQRLNHSIVVDRVRTLLDELRQEVHQATAGDRWPSPQELAERFARKIMQQEGVGLTPVINATGILLHTGLGRAPLAESALEAMVRAGRDYTNLEFNLQSGDRGDRTHCVGQLLRDLTGADAALVVNNNAGATLLTLAAVAAGREVIVSRGELVEIGGSYRLPDVMAASGARLREVGTTNRTRIDDYRRAIGADTAALLLVHPSNYVVNGFTESTSLADLVKLGRSSSLPVIHDIGSGALVDFSRFGLSGEPLAQQSLRQGADLVLFSGDKLLGGPQCGIVLGRSERIAQLKSHPLARALRVDKLTLAALAATLELYRQPDQAAAEIPLLQMLQASEENLRNRAERLGTQMGACGALEKADILRDTTYLGGGSIPGQAIPTWCVALSPRGESVDQIARRLRTGTPAVVGRIHQNRLLLDLRSVPPRHDQALVDAILNLARPTDPAPDSGPAH